MKDGKKTRVHDKHEEWVTETYDVITLYIIPETMGLVHRYPNRT